MIIRCWDTEISIFGFSAFSSGQPFWKCTRRGSESSNFISTLQILIFGALSIQKDICSFIQIWWVWMTDLPIASGLCLNSLFSRIFTRGNFLPYICLYLKNVPHINLNWIRISRRQFSNSHSSYFCGHEYKILFCNKLYISPYPKIAIFFRNHVSYKRQLCRRALW